MSVRDYGLNAPHGPNPTGEHTATMDLGDITSMSSNEMSVFRSLLRPDDSYDESGTYWADMGIGRRLAFVTKLDAKEAASELRSIGRMMKADPLSPVGYYFRNMVIPGAGLLLEGYVLFSIGNIQPLLAAAFPTCWKTKNDACNYNWISALTYLEIIGIIIGQIMVGFIGDWIGRRWGLIQDAVIMFVGLLMLTAAWGTTLNGWVICYAWSLFFYSIGVGGEYPMTATSGMENAVGSGKVSTRDDRMHRGRKVTSAFLMQGWGQFFNQVILILLLLIFHHGSGDPPYSKVAVQWTYRISFAIPAVGTLWLVYFRTYKMKAASKQLSIAKKKSKVTGYDTESLKLTLRYFGPRLFATATAWFANDVFFYGNKLFQSQFIEVITDSKSVMVTWLWNLLNVGVSLIGYYMASFLIDNKLYGRVTMMNIGFLADFLLFVIPAFNYGYYSSKAGVHSFQAMYFLSSFFNQFGPNAVTFIVAAEVFPTPVRATAHGFSAACGKLGALVAAILYNYIDVQLRFYVVPWFGLLGLVVTFVFMPDTTGLDLKEQERRWAFIRAGREYDYHGVAINPKHLSLWERMRGVGRQYDPELDYQQRVEEMRHEWEMTQQRKAEIEKANNHDDYADDDWHSDVSSYFQRTRPNTIKNGNSPFILGQEKDMNYSPMILGNDKDVEKHLDLQ